MKFFITIIKQIKEEGKAQTALPSCSSSTFPLENQLQGVLNLTPAAGCKGFAEIAVEIIAGQKSGNDSICRTTRISSANHLTVIEVSADRIAPELSRVEGIEKF